MTLPHRTFSVAALALVVLALPVGVRGQEPAGATFPLDRVERTGQGDVALDGRIARLLRERPWHHLAKPPLVLAGDTLVVAGDTIDGPVLVLDATLILEGTVTGDLVLVDAGAFVRPGSRVGGDLVNIGGGLYRSTMADVGGTILDLPSAAYRVVREPDRMVIEAVEPPAAVVLDGLGGFWEPTYDRVNGVTLVWGARYRLPRVVGALPSVHGHVGWRTELGDPAYGASAELRWPTRALDLGFERGSATTDEWIRGDLSNSVSYLYNGRDYRDYHEVERGWVGLEQSYGDPLQRMYSVLSIRGQVEDATTLVGDEPWHLLGDSTRSNPAIDDGRTTSIIAGLDVNWHGLETWFEGSVEYEMARDWLDGDFDFDRVQLGGTWAMHALADHTLEVDFFAQRPLDGVLPRQRWSFVGGPGTLQTVEFRRFTGDRVVFVETVYWIPMPDRYHIPILGAPVFGLAHSTGMAWTDGQDRSFEQEVGLRVQLLGLEIRYMLDPTDPSEGDLDIALAVEFGGRYRWER